MNWYDPSNKFNQQYLLTINNTKSKYLYWPGELGNININNYCKPLEQNYYDNYKIRIQIDNIFQENNNIPITKSWSMDLFKKSISSTDISCIKSEYSNISSLYLVNSESYFFICQTISDKLYPLVVFAEGENLNDIMLYKHNPDTLYEWFYDGLDNSYTSFSKNNNLGTVFSWYSGANSSEEVKNFTEKILDISHNKIMYYNSAFKNDLSFIAFTDSS